MDINGIVVIASETVKFEKEDGLLLTFFNSAMDIHFCILAHDISVSSWKKIRVNYCYEITNLKVGVLEASSGSKKFVLKTTGTSTFKQIENHHVTEFEVTTKLKPLIEIPALCNTLKTDMILKTHFISYQGLVTKIKDKGVYELDYKVLVFTLFNFCTFTPGYIKIGSEVFVSNAHLLKCDKKIILLCCGLSSILNISEEEEQVKVGVSTVSNDNVCLRYSLSIYDFLWLERLSIRLKMKFSTLVVEEDVTLFTNADFFNNVMEFFLSFENEPPINAKPSLVHEYFSIPHECKAFTENRLPIDIDVPYLSDIMEKATETISWINISKNWKISINFQDNLILIGLLSLSPDGNFQVSDATGKLTLLLSLDCSCTHEHDIIQEFGNLNYASIVAICEYDIIFENVLCKNATLQQLQYIRTSWCRLFSLSSYYKSKKEELNNSCLYKRLSKDSVDNQVKKNNVDRKLKMIEFMSIDESYVKIRQRFLFISTMQKSTSLFYRALVLFLPEDTASFDNSLTMITDLEESSFNYYETNDDFEFANLITKLDNLSIDSNSRLVFLNFKSANICAFLCSGHIYFADLQSAKMEENISFMQNNVKVLSIDDSSNLEITHDPNCLANLNLDEAVTVKYISVKDILLNRNISADCIIKAIVIDKFYDDDNSDKTRQKATICLKIKDIVTSETIPAYIPYSPKNLFGMLPGTLLVLYGFVCISSQMGSLYLKPMSTFGVEMKTNQKFENVARSNSTSETVIGIGGKPDQKQSETNSFLTPYRCMFFIVKLVSAEVFAICNECQKNFKECCSCENFAKANVKVSALVDDGRKIFLAACSGSTARVFLGLDECEWNCLASYVEQHKKALKFSEKMHPVQISCLPLMHQVFYYYCTSRSICQRLYLECIYILNTDIHMMDVPSVWCKHVVGEHKTRAIMSEFYTRLKHSS